jgi:isoaspartyl peptidase/L-asparaginase-like protein (Ntn-hydrolase superfamily)
MDRAASQVPALVLHGGAGTVRRHTLTPDREDAFHHALRQSLAAGWAILTAGGDAVDAVTAAVKVLEDAPLFNAGRGAAFNADGRHEMDAAIMDGRGCRAGAVAGLCGPRHPIVAARAVMDTTAHVMLAGEGARRFCRDAGLEHKSAAWFHTEARWQALQGQLARRRQGLPDSPDDALVHGTVGAVAVDAGGNLAAATSTGGLTAKLPGRVGDSPVIGAGTWADNATCAVSATGHGEFFIRHAACHEVDARIRWAGQALDEACSGVVHRLLSPAGGSGGLVAVDARGEISLPFNCPCMYRGFVKVDGRLHTAIHAEPYRIVEIGG